MPTTYTAPAGGDTYYVIGDKVRAQPANQGKNDNAMWVLIDAEVVQQNTASGFKNNHTPTSVHGAK